MVKGILFIRICPATLGRPVGMRHRIQSVFSGRGATIPFAGHEITFLFTGFGEKQRTPHPLIIDKINSGLISDVVDIGGGGALDPNLQRGDIVISTDDYHLDTPLPLKVKRREEITGVISKVAAKFGRRFTEGKILTSPRIIASREERTSMFERTQCSVVQMEHYKFIKSLQQVINPEIVNTVYTTHIEIVSDAVPEHDTFPQKIKEFVHGIDYCLLRNNKYIGRIKSSFLEMWLSQ